MLTTLSDTPPRKRFYDRVGVRKPISVCRLTAEQFETISHFLSPREPPPSMLLDRTNDEEDITLPSATTRRELSLKGIFFWANSFSLSQFTDMTVLFLKFPKHLKSYLLRSSNFGS